MGGPLVERVVGVESFSVVNLIPRSTTVGLLGSGALAGGCFAITSRSDHVGRDGMISERSNLLPLT